MKPQPIMTMVLTMKSPIDQILKGRAGTWWPVYISILGKRYKLPFAWYRIA